VGAHAPGGAFQAGAMLSAAMILQQLANTPPQRAIGLRMLRILLVAGILIFVLVGIWMMSLNDDFLAYTPAWAGALILVIETAATLSIASALTLAYIGGRPTGWEDESNARRSIENNGKAP
jgi:multisubunit Na+/H+ antiporter MnhB subunit